MFDIAKAAAKHPPTSLTAPIILFLGTSCFVTSIDAAKQEVITFDLKGLIYGRLH